MFDILISMMEFETGEQYKIFETQKTLQRIKEKEDERSKSGRFLETQIAESGQLDAAIHEIPDLWGYDAGIVVGNTGLFFVNDEGTVFKHFLPDGSSMTDEDSRTRFRDAFYVGYEAFLHWYEKPANRTFGSLNEIKTIYGITNPRMRKFQEKTFGSHIAVIGTYQGDYEEEDITALQVDSLLKDELIRRNIKTHAESALKKGYQMGAIPQSTP